MGADPPIRWDKVRRAKHLLVERPTEAAEAELVFQLFKGNRWERLAADLEADHSFRRNQARVAFCFACVMMAIGTAIVILGVLLLVFGVVSETASWTTIATGGVTQAITAVPFSLWKRASAHFENASRRLEACRLTSLLPLNERGPAVQSLIASMLHQGTQLPQ